MSNLVPFQLNVIVCVQVKLCKPAVLITVVGRRDFDIKHVLNR